MATDGGVPRRLLNAPILPYFSWSPDGHEIVYSTPVSELPGLWVVTVADGRTRRLLTPGGATSPAWSPTADVIAYLEVTPNTPGQQAGALVRFTTGAGQSVARDIGQTLPFVNGFLTWSPDGRAIAAARIPGTAAASLWIAELEPHRAVRQVFKFPDDALIRGMTWTAEGALGDRRAMSVGGHSDTMGGVQAQRPASAKGARSLWPVLLVCAQSVKECWTVWTKLSSRLQRLIKLEALFHRRARRCDQFM